MTTNQLTLAIAAGLISAVVFASATTGPMILRFVLFFLTPLSLYLAGLGIGPRGAAIAAFSATVTILFLTNPLAALVFAVSAGAPAVIATRLTLLGRPLNDEDGAPLEWYPIGRIVLAHTVVGVAQPIERIGCVTGNGVSRTRKSHHGYQRFGRKRHGRLWVELHKVGYRRLNLFGIVDVSL